MISFGSLASLLSRYPRLPRYKRALLWETLRLLRRVHRGLACEKTAPLREKLWAEAEAADPLSVSPQEITWAIDWVGRLIPDAKCLPRALVAESLLRRAGHESDLKFGVRRGGPGAEKEAENSASANLEAHAWVICDGEIIVGDLPDLASYAVLECAPSCPN